MSKRGDSQGNMERKGGRGERGGGVEYVTCLKGVTTTESKEGDQGQK